MITITIPSWFLLLRIILLLTIIIEIIIGIMTLIIKMIIKHKYRKEEPWFSL